MKLSKWALILALAGVVMLTGCSTVPYQTSIPKSVQREIRDRNKPAASANSTTLRAVAFCYSDMINTPEDLMEEAKLICGTGKVAYQGTDNLWTPCSLLQPSRATFTCTPDSAL